MYKFPDLTGVTFGILFLAIVLIPQVRTHRQKITWSIRIGIAFVAILSIAIILRVNLQPIKENGDVTVCVTDTGTKYHSEECRHLYNSSHSTSLKAAVNHGYRKCSNCSSPVYIKETIIPTLQNLFPSVTLKNLSIVSLAIMANLLIIFLPYYISKLIKKIQHSKPNR